MNTWFPLWSSSPDSSLWDEPDFVFKVFMTMCAVKDLDHVCRFTAYQIGRKARKTEQEVLDALKILSSPDKKRKEKQDFDGRRVQAVEDGWLILNGEKYRAKVQVEMKKARDRRGQAAARERKKLAAERAARQDVECPREEYVHEMDRPPDEPVEEPAEEPVPVRVERPVNRDPTPEERVQLDTAHQSVISSVKTLNHLQKSLEAPHENG